MVPRITTKRYKRSSGRHAAVRAFFTPCRARRRGTSGVGTRGSTNRVTSRPGMTIRHRPSQPHKPSATETRIGPAAKPRLPVPTNSAIARLGRCGRGVARLRRSLRVKRSNPDTGNEHPCQGRRIALDLGNHGQANGADRRCQRHHHRGTHAVRDKPVNRLHDRRREGEHRCTDPHRRQAQAHLVAQGGQQGRVGARIRVDHEVRQAEHRERAGATAHAVGAPKSAGERDLRSTHG